MHEVHLEESDFFPGMITRAELLGHLDYLNQTQYIKAEFTCLPTRKMFPAQLKKEDFRVANSYGSSDGPLPLDYLQSGRTHGKGRKMLKRWRRTPGHLRAISSNCHQRYAVPGEGFDQEWS